GGAVYVATVAIDAFRRARARKNRTAPSIPMMRHPDDIRDPATRAAVVKLLANKAELQKILDDTPEDLQIHISKTLGSLDELEMNAVRLVERAEDIVAHLSKMN